MDRAYRNSIRTISLVMVGVGVAIVVATFVRGGELLDTGVVFGVLLAALGVGRLLLSRGGAEA